MAEILLSKGAWRTLAVACVAGCFAPQEIEPFVEPPVMNEPPTIDLLDVQPAPHAVCMSLLDESEDRRDLAITVNDPNGVDGQTLQARWFVDYQVEVPETTSPRDIQDLDPTQLGESVVYVRPSLTWDTIRRLRLAEGEHFVEVVVSDGFDNSSAEPRNRATLKDVCRGFEGDCYSIGYKWKLVWRENSPCE